MLFIFRVMNVQTDRKIDRQTDKLHEFHVYVWLAQTPINIICQKCTCYIHSHALQIHLCMYCIEAT